MLKSSVKTVLPALPKTVSIPESFYSLGWWKKPSPFSENGSWAEDKKTEDPGAQWIKEKHQ
jgi:hypothetical protein